MIDNSLSTINIAVIGNGDWGLGIGDWGLGIGRNAQSPIPNPQSPMMMNMLGNYIKNNFNTSKVNS